MQSYSAEEYQIGIICALPKELKAIRATFDEEHAPLKHFDRSDHNSYVLGRINQHNVVAAGLPAGVYGTTSAASVGRDMLRTFPQLRFGLMVGIGGGIPQIGTGASRDIRLGDIVVGQPDATHGGVVQYDLGKLTADGHFVRKGTLNKPPQIILTALTQLQADLRNDRVSQCLEDVDEKYPSLKDAGYCHQGADKDQLYCAKCEPSQWWWILWVLITWFWPFWRCNICVDGKVSRSLRSHLKPVIHYGTIASGNTLLKNTTKRDQLGEELGALCVEMEAAGLDDYLCLVIRGICDYADAHKNDVWQEYAAITAAAFAKVFLSYITPAATHEQMPVQQVLDQLGGHFKRQHEHNIAIQEHNERQDTHYQNDRHRDCHRAFAVGDYERQKNINAKAAVGTCRWILDHPRYKSWVASTSDLLWISADPGCGKSVFSKSLIDEWLPSAIPSTTTQAAARSSDTICYFFFKDNEEQNNLSKALCAILHQLFSSQPDLIRHALPAYDKNKPEILTTKVDELWRILQVTAINAGARPIICVLDALDECRERDRDILFDLLQQSFEDSASNPQSQGWLKWLVTSRPADDIHKGFHQITSNLSSIHIPGEDENDQIRNEIDIVIGVRMAEMSRNLGLSGIKTQEVTQQLRRMENRTYLWLHLVLESIETAFRRSARPNQVEVPLLPKNVTQAYENLLSRIVDEEKHHARLALTIIVGARRPLTVAEMALAFDTATRPEPPRCVADLTIDATILSNRIRTWCGLFVFIQHNHFYLIHQTAKEFLENHDDHNNRRNPVGIDRWEHSLHVLDLEKQMAEICVIFLSLSDLPDSDTESEHDDNSKSSISTFLDYSCQYWMGHVQSAESLLDAETLLRVRGLYNLEMEQLERWAFYSIGVVSTSGNNLDIHLAAYNGHCSVVRQLLSESPDKINKIGKGQRTPLYWAVAAGWKEMMELLVAHPNIDVNLGIPLAAATGRGDLELTQFILNLPGINVNANFGEPLRQAAASGCMEVVKLMLECPGIDINLSSRYDETARTYQCVPQDVQYLSNCPFPLAMAATFGHEKIVEVLLDQPDIDINFTAPLEGAVAAGHMEIVKLLLARSEIDVNVRSLAPLVSAVQHGHKDIVELLLSRSGTEVDMESLLEIAAGTGDLELLKLFLARSGNDVNLTRPLSEAAHWGNTKMIEVFLAQPSFIVHLEQPLTEAVALRRSNIVELLLARPEIDAEPYLGVPFTEAVRYGREDIIKLFLSRPNIKVNFIDALAAAAGNGQKHIIELLLAHSGVELDFSKPLSEAAANGHKDLVELFLAQSVFDIDYTESIANSAAKGYREILELLLAQPGSDIDFTSPLANAALWGSKDIVELLLARAGSDIDLTTPLASAAAFDKRDTVELLLAQPSFHGTNVQMLIGAAVGYKDIFELLLAQASSDIDLTEPLVEAARWGNVSTIKLILNAQPSLSIDLTQPLIEAAWHGYKHTVKLLLDRSNTQLSFRIALATSAGHGNKKAVELLLAQSEYEIDVSHALAEAAEGGYDEIVDLLKARAQNLKGLRSYQGNGKSSIRPQQQAG